MVGIIIMVVNYFYGKGKNKDRAIKFLMNCRHVFHDQFAQVGITQPDENGKTVSLLYEEASYQYKFWASGRVNMYYCLVDL